MTQSAQDNYQNVWGNKVGFGKKPALLVIDFLKGYTTEGSPLFAPGVISAVQESIDLISAARHHGIPVIHTKVRYHAQTFADGGMWIKKAPVLECLVEGNELANFCDEVLPLESETIIIKQYASAFFGTSLIATLNALDIDTVLMAGCTTSGCIRATAVDCIQYGFRPIVVEECVGDRHPDPHAANLFDIGNKYGDVVTRQETLDYLDKLFE